jgi:hypothetical protein
VNLIEQRERGAGGMRPNFPVKLYDRDATIAIGTANPGASLDCLQWAAGTRGPWTALAASQDRQLVLKSFQGSRPLGGSIVVKLTSRNTNQR